MAFHDVQFPVTIALRSAGGPRRSTQIVTLGSGREERNTRWADSRRTYNAGIAIRSLDDLHAVIAFFEQRRGRLHSFRWKDHADFRSCPPLQAVAPGDQWIAAGDGATSDFQLIKTYGSGPEAWARTITKPVPGTARIAVAGVEKSSGTDFTIDSITGVVSFLPAAIPAASADITAGYEFDVPVRFDSDAIQIDLAAFKAGSIPDIQLIEVRS